jgi:hypothetical protein
MNDQPLRITEEEARRLLVDARWLLIVCCVPFVAFAIYAYSDKFGGSAMIFFGLYWLAGVLYLIWLGRLAAGLRRSIVYYVLGTLLASGVVFLLAHIIAYAIMSGRVKRTFDPGIGGKQRAAGRSAIFLPPVHARIGSVPSRR